MQVGDHTHNTMKRERVRSATALVACYALVNPSCGFQLSVSMDGGLRGTGRAAITRPSKTASVRQRVIRLSRGTSAEIVWGCRIAGFEVCGAGAGGWRRGITKLAAREQDGAEDELKKPFTEVMHSNNPRRYVGPDAGMGDDTGVGGPRGDGRGQKWTPELCKRRLSLMHRKLRQVKDLLAKQAREPGSLDAAQLVKVDRKMDLQLEITELETLRRDLEREAAERAAKPAVSSNKRAKLPPGPFAGGMLSTNSIDVNDSNNNNQGEVSGSAPVVNDDVESTQQPTIYHNAGYTADGDKLAAPRRPVQPRPRASRVTGEASPDGEIGGDVGDVGVTFASEGRGMGDDESEFLSNEDFEDIGKASAVSSVEAWGARAKDAEDSEDSYSGGYPKKLAAAMSFCRVSTRSTCEILVAMGKVTVNGEKVDNPFMKIDVLNDIIVCDGEAVTLPPKIDNADLNRRPREDEGKRTGPIPKAEKNTWKAKVKYRWGTDEGLLASRTRRAANVKASRKRSREGGSGSF